MYFDSHAHYDDRRFKEDRDTLLSQTLPEAGVDFLVNIGCDLRTSKASIALAHKYDYIFATVGFHPHELHDINSQSIDELRKLAKDKKVVAIGEMGLDYHYDTHPREVQKFWFLQQLRLAEELDLPVVIHSREASKDTFDIIERSPIRKGVIHCYSGSAPMALDYVEMGYYIGIGGVVTFPTAKKLVEVVEKIPLEKIVIETDCPYLTPAPNRGKRNDSTQLQYVVQKIAEIKGVSVEEVCRITSENGKILYF